MADSKRKAVSDEESKPNKRNVRPKKERKEKDGKKEEKVEAPAEVKSEKHEPRTPRAPRLTYNEKFAEYYKNIIQDEAEYKSFIESCLQNLPTTWRESNYKKDAAKLTPFPVSITKTPIPWLSHANAFRSDIPYPALSRHPEFKKWLNDSSENGSIIRQEEVSMLPPLFFDIKKSDSILDMCSAPGSKSSHLLDLLHCAPDLSKEELPTGYLVANEPTERAGIACKQLMRMNSPCWTMTRHEAQKFPRTFRNGQHIRFDHILADVPCSGDGTIRKSYQTDWTPQNAMEVHPLQLSILLNGLSLLKPGGRLVYSTCSMNPIENEAVVLEALRLVGSRFGVSLKDVSSRLSGLKTAPCLTTWSVVDSDDASTVYTSYASVPEDRRSTILPSMFPPASTKKTRIERCLRIMPHLNNTGGFFVAIFERSAASSSSAAADMTDAEVSALMPACSEKLKLKSKSIKRDDQYIPLSAAPTLLESFSKSVTDHYGVDAAFSFANHFICRRISVPVSGLAAAAAKAERDAAAAASGSSAPAPAPSQQSQKVYFASQGLTQFISANSDNGHVLQIDAAGLSAFEATMAASSGKSKKGPASKDQFGKKSNPNNMMVSATPVAAATPIYKIDEHFAPHFLARISDKRVIPLPKDLFVQLLTKTFLKADEMEDLEVKQKIWKLRSSFCLVRLAEVERSQCQQFLFVGRQQGGVLTSCASKQHMASLLTLVKGITAPAAASASAASSSSEKKSKQAASSSVVFQFAAFGQSPAEKPAAVAAASSAPAAPAPSRPAPASRPAPSRPAPALRPPSAPIVKKNSSEQQPLPVRDTKPAGSKIVFSFD